MKKLFYLPMFLIIAFFFTSVGTLMAQNVTQNFESFSIGDSTSIAHIGWSQSDVKAVIVADPLASGNKVLRNTIGNYNAAPVLKMVLPAGKTLADYKTFTFKGYFAQGDVGYKDIVVEAYQTMPTGQAYNVAANKIGSFTRSQNGSTSWENITIPITGSASMKDTIYIAFGINCAGTGNIGGTGVPTIWYADDVSLVLPTILSYDFESYTIGDSTSIGHIGYGPNDAKTVIAADPLVNGNKVLKVTTTNYGAAPYLMFVLPSGKTLADYDSITFNAYYQAGDLAYKTIAAEAYQKKPTGHALFDADTNYFYVRTSGASTAWERISLAPKKASSFQDTVYIAFGTNNSGATWYADNVTLVAKQVVASPLVSNWGKTSLGKAWPLIPNATAGNIGLGDGKVPTGWATIGGHFSTLTATTSQAVVVSGQVQFVGGGGASAYTWLRYALTFQDSATLSNAGTDSALWVSSLKHYGYQFDPISGSGTMANSTAGQGTVWTVLNGNWTSSYSNGGIGPLSQIRNQPLNAVAIAGTYNWAVSVESVNDTVNEVRWYLIEQNNKYWFGGTIQVVSTSKKFNAINFGFNNDFQGTQVNFTNVQAQLGTPITVPVAPWQAYYLSLWGTTPQGKYWPITNDTTTIVGNATIKGKAPINAGGWATVQGGFGQSLQLKTDKALLVTGQLVFTGATGAGSSYTPLRYGIVYQDSAKLNYQNTDSANWTGPSGYSGYSFQPRTGAGTMANGAGGQGTVWTVNKGSWASTYSNNGGPIAAVLQAPINAQIVPGTYDFKFSIRQVNDTTNEVKWVLEEQNKKYWFAGSIMAKATTNKFNAICFGINSGDWTQLDVLNAQVDYGTPITIPPPPWQAYYVGQWGIFGNRFSGWKYVIDPDTIVGNAGIGGTSPVAANGWAALRGSFGQSLTPTTSADSALVVTGDLEFVGGGFESWASFRFGLLNSDSAGTVITTNPADSTRWNGVESGNYGYLFLPPSGNNAAVTWQGINKTGTYGAVNNSIWLSTANAADYVLGNVQQLPANAVGSKGTYHFELSVSPQSSGGQELRFKLNKSDNTYMWSGIIVDTHSPLTTTKFNSIAFAVGSGNTTTALKVTNVKIDMNKVITGVTGVENTDNNSSLPKSYALSQNYPNPFNPSTTIEFALPKSGVVNLTVYDILGRAVANLVNGDLTAGNHKVTFDASRLASGVYFYKLKAGDFVNVKKLMLLK